MHSWRFRLSLNNILTIREVESVETEIESVETESKWHDTNVVIWLKVYTYCVYNKVNHQFLEDYSVKVEPFITSML